MTHFSPRVERRDRVHKNGKNLAVGVFVAFLISMYIKHDGKPSLLSGEDLAYCATFVYTVLVGLYLWLFLQRQRRPAGPLAPAQERQCRAGGPQRGAGTGQQKA